MESGYGCCAVALVECGDGERSWQRRANRVDRRDAGYHRESGLQRLPAHHAGANLSVHCERANGDVGVPWRDGVSGAGRGDPLRDCAVLDCDLLRGEPAVGDFDSASGGIRAGLWGGGLSGHELRRAAGDTGSARASGDNGGLAGERSAGFAVLYWGDGGGSGAARNEFKTAADSG